MKRILCSIGLALLGIALLFLVFLTIWIFEPKLIDRKVNWVATRSSNSMLLKFDYFDGKEKIPIHLNSGDVLKVKYLIKTEKRERMTFSFTDPKGMFATYEPEGGYMVLKANRAGEYKMVITGTRLEFGEITVDWSINHRN